MYDTKTSLFNRCHQLRVKFLQYVNQENRQRKIERFNIFCLQILKLHIKIEDLFVSVFFLQERCCLHGSVLLRLLQQLLLRDLVRRGQPDPLQHHLHLPPHLPLRIARAKHQSR